MDFVLTVLGANSATPLPNRYPSSFVLRYDRESFLLDCGEGCQMKMQEFNVRPSKINHVFITHLHGDHLFGLPGFLNSLNHHGRKKALKIFGPSGLRAFIESIISTTHASFGYSIKIVEITRPTYHLLDHIGNLQVYCLPLKHRIPTYGYVFREKIDEINVRKEAIETYGLSIAEIKEIKSGNDVIREGKVIPKNK